MDGGGERMVGIFDVIGTNRQTDAERFAEPVRIKTPDVDDAVAHGLPFLGIPAADEAGHAGIEGNFVVDGAVGAGGHDPLAADRLAKRGLFLLLAGLGLNALLGWWWADPVAALIMVPIIANEGEGVFTKEQMAKLGGTNNTQNVTINSPVTVNASGGTSEQNGDLASQVSRQVEGTIRRTVIDELNRQSRPGNILSR